MITSKQFGFNAFCWERLWDEETTREVVTSLSKLGFKGVEYKETSFNPDDEVLGNCPEKAAGISMESLQKLWRQYKEKR